MGSLSRCAGGVALLLCLGGALAATPSLAQDTGAPATTRAGSLVFRDVAFGNFKIGGVELNGVVQDGASFRADSAVVTALSFEMEGFSLQIPSLRIAKLQSPKQFLDALTGAGASTDWIAVISAMSADEISADALTYRVSIQGEIEATTNGIVLERMDRGKLAVMRFASQDGRSQMPTPNGSSVSTVGATRYEDVDFGEALRFLGGGGSGPAKLLIARAEQAGMESRTANGEMIMRAGRSETRGFYGRAPADGLDAADIAALRAGQPDRALVQKLGRIATDVADTFRFEGGSVESFQVDTPVASIKIGTMNVSDYTFRSLGLFELRDLAVEAPETAVTLGRFALEKLDYGSLVDLGLSFLRNATPPDAKPIEIPPLVPTLGALRFENLDIDSPAGPMSLAGFTFGTTASGGMPDSLTTTLSRLALDLSAMPPTDGIAKLIELGYPEILADARIAVRYDKAAGALSVERSGASIDEAGSVEATLGVQGIDVDAMLETLGRAPELAMQARFGSLAVDIADLGFAQRFYDNVGKSAGVAPEAIRDGLAAQLRAQANAMFGPALAPGSADQIAKFLREPGRLSIRVAPRPDRPPLLVGEFPQLPPPLLADRVSVTIQASPK